MSRCATAPVPPRRPSKLCLSLNVHAPARPRLGIQPHEPPGEFSAPGESRFSAKDLMAPPGALSAPPISLFTGPYRCPPPVGALAGLMTNALRTHGFRQAARGVLQRLLPEQKGQPRRFICATKEAMMDWNRVEGNWKQMKGAVKQQWGKLTDDDLTQINGSQEKLEGIIQERYGIARDETRKQIDSWYRNQRWQ
jgi:uncharacterized protein YjbJ (UPF0337 family)